jgi:hypothetical protein
MRSSSKALPEGKKKEKGGKRKKRERKKIVRVQEDRESFCCCADKRVRLRGLLLRCSTRPAPRTLTEAQ